MTIEDLLNTCDSSEEMIEYCDRDDQRIFRNIISNKHIDFNRINPKLKWSPKDLVKNLEHTIYDKINEFETLSRFLKEKTIVDSFIIPDLVIKSFAKKMKVSVERLITSKPFRDVINGHYLLNIDNPINVYRNGYIIYSKYHYKIGKNQQIIKRMDIEPIFETNSIENNDKSIKFDKKDQQLFKYKRTNNVDVIIELPQMEFTKLKFQKEKIYENRYLINGIVMTQRELRQIEMSLE